MSTQSFNMTSVQTKEEYEYKKHLLIYSFIKKAKCIQVTWEQTKWSVSH
jgi:hypothetical protein